jgi:hypothetical protein
MWSVTSPRAARLDRPDCGRLCKIKEAWLRGCADDFGLRSAANFVEKKGLLLVGNPLCFVFLRIVAGSRFELTAFGL